MLRFKSKGTKDRAFDPEQGRLLHPRRKRWRWLTRRNFRWWVVPGTVLVLFFLAVPFMKPKVKVSDKVIASKIDAPFQIGCREPNTKQARASAAFVMLAKDSELEGVVKSVVSMETHFNQWYNYPWVFLTNGEFSNDFKTRVQEVANGQVEFGAISTEEWEFDPSVDPQLIKESIQNQGDKGILYGQEESYHKMCRFFSGKFFQHELVRKRDWYWRVEPNVEFFCDITYDPFIEMEKRGKKYGFNVMIEELYYTLPSLFRETKAFIKERKVKVKDSWKLFVKNYRHAKGKNMYAYDGIGDPLQILREIELSINVKKFIAKKNKKDGDLTRVDRSVVDHLFQASSQKPTLYEDKIEGEEYNLGHFWSNFEIARTDIFNSDLYRAYFAHLDKSGGFYLERWGDAPVHSLAIGMMLNLKEIHYFRDIGYRHSSVVHCPRNAVDKGFAIFANFASPRGWLGGAGNGVGCRCQCPFMHWELEDSRSSYVDYWRLLTSDEYRQPTPIDIDHWEEVIGSKIDQYLVEGGVLGATSVVDSVL